MPEHAEEKMPCPLPKGTAIVGPCGYGAEIAEDDGGDYVWIEHYMGDQERIRRDKIRGIVRLPDG